MTAVLEINDIGLLLSIDAEPIFESPGYAMVNDKEILIGERQPLPPVKQF